jgi:replicative DNA helicase
MNPSDPLNGSATEQSILAAVIADGTPALLTVMENGITPASFADHFCRRLHELILCQHAAGLPFDDSHLWERLGTTEAQSVLAPYEEKQRLVEITKLKIAFGPMLSSLCAELRALAVRRNVFALSARLAEAAKVAPDDVAGLVGELLATQAESAKVKTWKRVCDEAEGRAQDAIAGKIDTEGFISWGFPLLDAKFKPMRKGELVIIGARPSVGKSSFARGIATAAALAGRRVLFETLEVSADDVADGMATGHSGVPLAELAGAPADLQKRFLQSLAQLRVAPLHVCEDRTLASIMARAQSMQAQHPLDVLVLDYLGLVADCKPGKGETTAQAVGTVTKALKRLAMEMKIVVVCLAQLNRQSVNDGNREPRLSDLRDSGDIEQDADRVLFIHRPDDCPISQRKQDTLDTLADLPRYGCTLIQAKGRNAGTAYGTVWFHRRLARFEFEPARSHAAAA